MCKVKKYRGLSVILAKRMYTSHAYLNFEHRTLYLTSYLSLTYLLLDIWLLLFFDRLFSCYLS